MKCGTTYSYKLGCRCSACRQAQANYARRFRAGVRLKKGRPFKAIRHGTTNAYVKRGCRCRECRLFWREYTREQARRLRGYKSTKAEHSICITCGQDFVPKRNAKACSPYCSVQMSRRRQRLRRTWAEVSSEEIRNKTKHAVAEVAAHDHPELAELISDQFRDERLGHLASRHTISLDAMQPEGGAERYEQIGSEDLDPAIICIGAEDASRIRAVIGYETEEEIARLNYHTQEWLAYRLREEGLVGTITVASSERIRLRQPQAHTGADFHGSGSWGGKAKRLEKIKAQHHKRPSQRPPKRWSRLNWNAVEEVA